MAVLGFTTCNSTASGAVFRIPGTSRSVRLRRETAPLLLGLAAEYHRLVSPIDSGTLDDWGYACRAQRGASVTSWHAAGIALDLNALKFPMGRRNMSARQRATCRALARKYGCRWGGDFSRPDEMHFEIIKPRGEALALVARLQKATPAHAAVDRPRPRLGKLRFGARNSDIVLLQQQLARRGHNPGRADGAYGPRTRAAVAAFQRAQGWGGADANGHMGPGTLGRLF